MNMGGWQFTASFWGVAGAVTLGAAGAGLFVREWVFCGGKRARRILAVSRIFAVALVSLTLLKPERVIQTPLSERPRVHVLWDDSLSTKTRDQVNHREAESPPMSREQWIQTLLAPDAWESLRSRFELQFIPFSQTPEAPAGAEGTDLHTVLKSQLTSNSGLRALVLVSDGDWNTGKNPLSAASDLGARGIPVLAVHAGSDTHLPDVEVQSLQAPSYSLVGERIAASFRVLNHLRREIRTRVTLTSADAVLAESEVVIPPMGEITETLTFTPQEEGEMQLRVEVPVQAGEVDPTNNAQQARLSVRRETLKVLLIDTAPRWEIRYLRNALARDPGVELKTVLLHPQLGPARGEGYIPEIPSTMESLQGFDVVFVGDIGIQKADETPPGLGMSAESAKLLRALVEEQASGLVFLPGAENRQHALLDSALGELFPVETGSGAGGEDSKNPSLFLGSSATGAEGHMELTLRGRSHWLTLLTADPASNESVWRTLPGFQWYAPVVRTRPGAEVLAVHDTARNRHGRVPLLVTRNAGLGKVLYMGTDSAWRWRRGVEDTYHYRFWGQVVRWMSHQRHLSQGEGVRLFYTPSAPRQGDTVRVHATLLDALGAPVGNADARVTVSSPGGARETLPMTPSASAWGALSVSFLPREAGAYALRLESPSTGRSLTTSIEVQSASTEKVGMPSRSAVLREIALLSGGSFLSGGAADALPEKINLLPEHPARETRLRLWCHPLWEGVILGVWLALWAGRKFRGLA